jgi:serine/threonine-protein kinase HipA
MDPRFVESIYVLKDNERIGTLTRTAEGALFRYDVASTRAVSYTMPLSRNSYESRGVNLHPFFAGLLPEGLRLHALQASVKTSKDDLFSLLIASGPDTIGDISLSSLKDKPNQHQVEALGLDEISFEELFQKKVLLSGPKDNLAIAGVQPKISAAMISFPLRVAKKNKSYIVKLEPKDFPQIIQNEAFFMSLAKNCGIQTPHVQTVTDKEGKKALLIERFDRFYDVSKKVLRKIHQEDACQFLSRYPADKYRLTLSEICEGISQFGSTPLLDIAKLLKVTAFSYMIGNGDLHGKNISLYEDPETGYCTVSPAYDLLSTLVYGDSSMALSVEGRNDNIKLRDFINLGERFGVLAKITTKMLSILVNRVESSIPKLTSIGLSEKKRIHLEKTMMKRIKHLSA